MIGKLHDDYERAGYFGTDYALVVGPDEITVVLLADGQELKRDKRYKLDEVYARLIHDAYERGRTNKSLW